MLKSPESTLAEDNKKAQREVAPLQSFILSWIKELRRPRILLGLCAVLLLLYALVWVYRFVVSQFGPFAPLPSWWAEGCYLHLLGRGSSYIIVFRYSACLFIVLSGSGHTPALTACSFVCRSAIRAQHVSLLHA